MTTITSPNNKIRPGIKEYNTFIKQIRIEDIRLMSAKIENLDCSYFPASAEVKWKITDRFESKEGKFTCYQRYNLGIYDKSSKIEKAKISVTFCVTYSSKIVVTEQIFNIFKSTNLPINTWPYFREFIHNSIARMGWPAFIAPTFTQ